MCCKTLLYSVYALCISACCYSCINCTIHPVWDNRGACLYCRVSARASFTQWFYLINQTQTCSGSGITETSTHDWSQIAMATITLMEAMTWAEVAGAVSWIWWICWRNRHSLVICRRRRLKHFVDRWSTQPGIMIIYTVSFSDRNIPVLLMCWMLNL